MRIILSILCFVIPTILISEEIPESSFSSGNWHGKAYTSDTTGQFSHCSISANYVSGNTLLFSVNKNASVTVGVVGELGLKVGQQFPVSLYVDRRKPFYGTAEALETNFAVLTLSDFEGTMNAFKKGYTLVIEALGTTTPFSLKGTFRALDAATVCAVENYDYAVTTQKSQETRKDKTALFQLAASVTSSLGITDFQFLTENELKQNGWGNAVVWNSERVGATGISLFVATDTQTPLRATDADDTQFIARECEGDYATSARSIALSANVSGRELRLICSTDGVESEILLTKFRAGQNVVYNVLIIENSALNFENETWSAKNEIAVVSAVKHVLNI